MKKSGSWRVKGPGFSGKFGVLSTALHLRGERQSEGQPGTDAATRCGTAKGRSGCRKSGSGGGAVPRFSTALAHQPLHPGAQLLQIFLLRFFRILQEQAQGVEVRAQALLLLAEG